MDDDETGAAGPAETAPPPGAGPRTHRGDLTWPLDRAARLYDDAPAVVTDGQALNYGDLERRVDGLGAALAELGISAGDRVGVLAENSLAHLEAWLGIPAHGRVICDLNFRLAESELVFIADDAGIGTLLTDDAWLGVARRLRERCKALARIVHMGPGPCPDDCVDYETLVAADPVTPPAHHPDTLAAISYTGGTTGVPKGVMLSHANLLSNAQHNLISVGHRHSDTFLHVCPMFHVAGTANVLAATWAGARQVILPRFAPDTVAATIERERVTLMLLVPTMIARLLDHLDEHPCDLSSIRELGYAASPVPPRTQLRMLERFDCQVAQFYGMTEAAPSVTRLGADDHRRGLDGSPAEVARLSSAGIPLPGVELQIRDPETDRELPPGTLGEVCVRGPNIMLGYWNRPEASAEALRGGWYRSGDLGRIDRGGYLFVVDRLKDMIVSGAENVYSIEVEAALVAHPAVSEAAVFGIPHAEWGEAVQAAIVLVDGATVDADELTAFCRSRIAGYKLPRGYDFHTEPLPKSGAGKVLKTALRDPYWAGHDRRVG